MTAKLERCEFCLYFAVQSSEGGDINLFSDLAEGLGFGPETGDGFCRRYPPSPTWPGVMMADWCGEFLAGHLDNVVKLKTE